MVPTETVERAVDPVEALHTSLEGAWERLIREYDAEGCIPDLPDLFLGADLTRSDQSAQMVLVCMLQEIMEAVGRFSPWYRQPARAFGLASVRDPLSGRARWMLAPEAVERWREILEPIERVIQKFGGLIHAMLLVEGLMEDLPSNDPCVTAKCACWPPRQIQLRQSVLVKAEIICDTCLQPFLERP